MTTVSQLIRTDHCDGIVEIGLNRAPVNALSTEFLMEFAGLLDDLADDPTARALVLSSKFKVFSAGIDLKEAINFNADDQTAMVNGLNIAFLKLFAFPKPVVVAVGGAAIAGGLFFILTSDYRIAGPRAKFGLAEVRVGVDFPVGPMELARATLGPNGLRRLMLTGRPMDAAQAQAIGMIDEIEPDEAILLDRALRAARDLAASPPEAYALVKRQIRQNAITRIETAMADGPATAADGWFTAGTRAAMQRMIGGA
jgi:enoyl-CoA hydratase